MLNNASNNKRIAKNTLFLYLRMMFTMVISLYTSRIVLATLGIVDYGISNAVGGIVSMFTFLNSSMSQSTQRFLTFELGKDNFNQLTKVFSTSVVIHFVISIIIFLLGETIGMWFLENKMVIPETRLFAAKWVLHFSLLSMMLTLNSVPYNALIIAHEKMSAFAYISILEVSLKLAIVYILYITELDKLIMCSLMWLLATGVIQLIYVMYCKKKFNESKIIFSFDRLLFKQMFSFAGWTLLSTYSWVLQTQGLNLLLNVFFGPVVNAARGIAVQVQGSLKGFVQNFQTALNPQITKSYAANDIQYMHSLIYASSKYSFYLIYIISLPIILKTQQILDLWLIDVPEYTVQFIRIILLISMVDAVFNSYMVGVNATGKNKKMQLTLGSIWILIVPISYLLLKLGAKPLSVFMIQFVISVIAYYMGLIICKKQIKMKLTDFSRNVLINILLVVAISFPISALITKFSSNNLLAFLTVVIVSILITVMCIYVLGINKQERVLINSKLFGLYNRMVKN